VGLHIVPLDAPFGAEVTGLDPAAPLDAELVAELRAALDDHLLLLFRNGDALPHNAHVAARCTAFGALRPTLADRSRYRDQPGINRVSNRDADGVQGTGGSGPVGWHSDLHFQPPLIEFVYLDAVAVPGAGGQTSFADLRAAYDALDPEMRRRVDDLQVHYRWRPDIDFAAYFKASDPESLATEATVPLVYRNTRTGRRSVWPNDGPDFVVDVVGLSPEEGRSLLRDLVVHCTQPRFVYRHEWRRGDAVLWNNIQALHRREAFDDSAERVMRHVNILAGA
jgi:alpha-ketoglutarate-dependent taurine dioxygenase